MARSFNGSSDYMASATGITCPMDGSAGPWTIALWFRALSNSQSNTYIWQATDSGALNQYAIIYEYVNNTVEFYSSGYSGTNPRTGSGITVADTNWHHIAYRKDASGTSSWNYFLDGAKTEINSSIAFTLPGAVDRMFAGSAIGPVAYCNCELAELAAWDYAVSDAEMAALAKGFSPLFTRPAIGFYWQLLGNNSPETPLYGGQAWTLSGTSKADHPRILMPQPARVHYLTPAGGSSIAPISDYYRRLCAA